MKNEKFSKFVLFLNQKTNYTFGTQIMYLNHSFSKIKMKMKNKIEATVNQYF